MKNPARSLRLVRRTRWTTLQQAITTGIEAVAGLVRCPLCKRHPDGGTSRHVSRCGAESTASLTVSWSHTMSQTRSPYPETGNAAAERRRARVIGAMAGVGTWAVLFTAGVLLQNAARAAVWWDWPLFLIAPYADDIGDCCYLLAVIGGLFIWMFMNLLSDLLRLGNIPGTSIDAVPLWIAFGIPITVMLYAAIGALLGPSAVRLQRRLRTRIRAYLQQRRSRTAQSGDS